MNKHAIMRFDDRIAKPPVVKTSPTRQRRERQNALYDIRLPPLDVPEKQRATRKREQQNTCYELHLVIKFPAAPPPPAPVEQPGKHPGEQPNLGCFFVFALGLIAGFCLTHFR